MLELSMEECARSHVLTLDTAQLLVGLCAEEKGIAALVLAEAGLTTDVARDAVSRITGTNVEPPPQVVHIPEVVSVSIEVRRADGSVTRETLPGVLAALEYLARQP